MNHAIFTEGKKIDVGLKRKAILAFRSRNRQKDKGNSRVLILLCFVSGLR